MTYYFHKDDSSGHSGIQRRETIRVNMWDFPCVFVGGGGGGGGGEGAYMQPNITLLITATTKGYP